MSGMKGEARSSPDRMSGMPIGTPSGRPAEHSTPPSGRPAELSTPRSGRPAELYPRLTAAGELPACRLEVRRAHERLADQDGVDAHAVELVELLARGESGLRDDRLPSRDVGQELVRALDVDGEVAEVAVVDADHLGLDVERDLQLVLVVDLDQHVEVERPRLP